MKGIGRQMRKSGGHMKGSGRQASQEPDHKQPAWETNEKNWETNERKWETSQPGTGPQAPTLGDKLHHRRPQTVCVFHYTTVDPKQFVFFKIETRAGR